MDKQRCLSVLVLACAGCGGDDSNPDHPGGSPRAVPDAYTFDSRFVEGASSVHYAGQTWRHTGIADLVEYVGALTADIDGTNPLGLADASSVVSSLDFYLRFDESNGGTPLLLSTEPPASQSTYDDISAGKDLIGKLAGNDPVTDHVDWSVSFVGWSDPSISGGAAIESPEDLIVAFFRTIGENASARLNGGVQRYAPGADPIAENQLPVYLTEAGLDLQQLLQKVLLGAIAYSQGTDDYLDDDVDGKGLLASNVQDGDAAYTTLEHAWDEGFGYFGAARDYDLYTDEEIAKSGGRDDWQGYHDSNGDGAIDLESEMNFGHSTNAAKRDLGSSDSAPTNYTQQAFDAFVTGRAIIASAGETLSDAELGELRAQRDLAVDAWERSIAATAVHYINDVLKDMNASDYSFSTHAKHWGELKGFSLSLQFNPRSRMSDEDFTELHALLGDRPALPEAAGGSADEASRYQDDLLAARDLFLRAYDFDATNVGDENGEGGW